MKSKLLGACGIALFVGMTATALADTRTWNQPSGGNWSAASNWDGAVPTHGDTVILPDAETSQTRTVDVRGVTYHASVGANLPAGGTTGGNAQMYWFISDYPMSGWRYVNYADWGAAAGDVAKLPATSNFRWRGDPNDNWRTVDVSGGDYADFVGKYHPGNGVNHAIYGQRSKTEADVPTPMAAFDLVDVMGNGPPKLYVAHDVANTAQRPAWLSTAFTATGKQLHTVGGLTWDVFERTVTSNTAAIGDSAGWIGDGGRLASLTIQQSTAGATQTLALVQNVWLGAAPVMTVTDGVLVIDVGARDFFWYSASRAVTWPANVILTLNGGRLYAPDYYEGITGNMTIASGGRLSGTGVIGGRGDLIIEEGGVLEVGSGTLEFVFFNGHDLKWRGAIMGHGQDSVLYVGSHQLKGIENMSANANASICGVGTLRINPNYDNLTFGRFVDPEKIDLTDTTLDLRNKTFLWEAQVTTKDVASHPADTPFKLGAYYAAGGTLKLQNTGSDVEAFAYIGQLTNLYSYRRLNLNDVALLTDMSETQLDAVLAYVDNSGFKGAPTVKSVKLQDAGTMWYLAPADVEIPPPPALGTRLVVR